MTRDEYIRRFDLAAITCREFAQRWVIDQLPKNIKFDIPLYEPPKVRDERVKLPWGGRLILPEELIGIEYVKARKIFWVDGRIPVWINFNVDRTDGDFTIIEIHASDHLTDNDEILYHLWEGNPPFHILSPSVPGDPSLFDQDGKFNLSDAGKGSGILQAFHTYRKDSI
jgi:hypothetical protein